MRINHIHPHYPTEELRNLELSELHRSCLSQLRTHSSSIRYRRLPTASGQGLPV